MWSGSRKGKYTWTFDCLFFFDWRAVSWRWRVRSSNVYQSACRRGIFVCFTCFPLLGCVFVRNGVVWRIHFILCFFSCFFCYCCYPVYHTVPLRSVFLKFCTFLGRIGMQGISMAYCYRCSLVCLSVCWIQPWAKQKRINWSRCRLGCVRLGSGSPEEKGQCGGHVPLRY